MTLDQIEELLKTTGLPVVYCAWPGGHAPPLPWIAYHENESGSDNFAADGVVYYQANGLTVELYTQNKEPETEAKVEQALASVFWQKTEYHLDSERCYEIVYECEV